MRSKSAPRAVALVAAIALVFGCTGCDQHRPTSLPHAPAAKAPTAKPATTTRDNLQATRQASAWLLHAVKMPAGAREWRHSPNAHFRQGSVGIGPADGRFTRTTWWTVPLSSSAFEAWLHLHAPKPLKADSDSGSSVESTGVWEHDVDFRLASTRAHTRGFVNFAFLAQDGRLVVRVDTFIGARFARDVFVPTDTTVVTIQRTTQGWRPHARAHTRVRKVTDPAKVESLVRMINALPGAMTTPFVSSCPDMIVQRRYAMTFDGPSGHFVANLRPASCWAEVALTHEGVTVGPPLEPGQRFTEIADAFL